MPQLPMEGGCHHQEITDVLVIWHEDPHISPSTVEDEWKPLKSQDSRGTRCLPSHQSGTTSQARRVTPHKSPFLPPPPLATSSVSNHTTTSQTLAPHSYPADAMKRSGSPPQQLSSTGSPSRRLSPSPFNDPQALHPLRAPVTACRRMTTSTSPACSQRRCGATSIACCCRAPLLPTSTRRHRAPTPPTSTRCHSSAVSQELVVARRQIPSLLHRHCRRPPLTPTSTHHRSPTLCQEQLVSCRWISSLLHRRRLGS
jgi:hypothetical protein